MIVVELQRPVAGSVDYVTAAILRVEDDGSWAVFGDHQLVDTSMRVFDSEAEAFVIFDEDPIGWARHLRSALRTGYLVPVTRVDTTASMPTGSWAADLTSCAA